MLDTTKNMNESTRSEEFLDDDFNQWIQSLMDEYHVPGMSIAVVRGGEVEAAGYGVARFPDVPATKDTIYCMASTTKAFTAAAMGLLIEESIKNNEKDDKHVKLSWSTPLKSILKDDFETKDQYITDNMSFEDALSHRTGMAGHDLIWGPWLQTPAEATRLLRHLDVNEGFRVRCQYNNMVFGTVGHAIEAISGQDFATVLKTRVLDPLGMENTFMGPEEAVDALAHDKDGALATHFAKGYQWITENPSDQEQAPNDKKTAGYYVADAHTTIWPINPAGALMSTVAQYAKWAAALLQSSQEPQSKDDPETQSSTTTKGKRLLSNALWKELTTPRTFWLPVANYHPEITPAAPNTHINAQTYALGWVNDPYTYPGQIIVQHAGGIPSFGSQIFVVPNENFAVITAGNTAGTSNKIGEFVAKELMGRKIGISKEKRRHRHDKDPETTTKEQKTPSYHASDPNFAHASLNLTSGPAEPNDGPAQSDNTSTFYLDSHLVVLPQTFSHPAYGSFSVSIAPKSMALSFPQPLNNGNTIIRTKSKDINVDAKDGIEQHAHTLSVRPMGDRSLKYHHLLHPSAVLDNKIVYDLEQLMRHGPPDTSRGDLPDPFPNCPPGHGKEDDEKYPYRNVQVWTSDEKKINGAVLVLAEKDQTAEKRFVVERLGLRFARVEELKDVKNGVLEDGWEKRMVWFTPVCV